ncbi:TRL domain-containing protein [Helicobacter sp. 23-1045]
MKAFLRLAMVAMAVIFAGCASAVTPFSTNVEVKPNEAKYAESTCRWVFGIRFKGCSVDEAIREAGITQVQTINYDFFHIGVYNSQTIGVRGK